MISLDDDGQVEITTSQKKLSNLFEDDSTSTEDSKSKLFYKPKSNKKSAETKPSSSSNQSKLSVFIALAVNVYKYDNDKYSYIGKYGMALLGNDAEIVFRIILYTAKNQPICSVTITETFQLIIQQKNYCSFKDDQRQNWSVLFANETDLGKFCRHISHCLFAIKFANDPNDSQVIQPLCCQKSTEDWWRKIDSDDVICYKLMKITSLERNQSFTTIEDQDVVEKEIEHRCLIKNNLDIIKQLFGNLVPSDRNYVIMPINKLDFYKSVLPMSAIANIIAGRDNIWKIALEIQLLRCEKPSKQREKPVVADENEEIIKKPDLAEKMSRIGALPIMPMINNKKLETRNKNDDGKSSKSPETRIHEETREFIDSDILLRKQEIMSHHRPLIHSDDNCSKSIETKLDLLQKNVEDLKLEMRKSNSKPNLFDSNLTLDSAILLNSIQKLVDDNHKLKSELDDKKTELNQLNLKIIQMIPAQTSDGSNKQLTSGHYNQNYNIVLKLKEEIVDLKDRINELKEENYRLQREKDQLLDQSVGKPSPRPRKHQLKPIFNEIHNQFVQAIHSISSFSEKDQQNVANVLASVLKTVANNDVPDQNHLSLVECDGQAEIDRPSEVDQDMETI